MSANRIAKTSDQTFPVPSGWTDVTLKFLGLKCSCHVKRYIYGVAQHHNEWDILSIMAHTLLPNTTPQTSKCIATFPIVSKRQNQFSPLL